MTYGYEDSTLEDHYDAVLDHLDSLRSAALADVNKLDAQIRTLEDKLETAEDANVMLSVSLQESRETTNRVYSQRAIAAVAFAHTVLSMGGTAGVGIDDHKDKDPEYRVVLYVDTPAGQMSWHIAPADQPMLKGLPEYAGVWDGLWNSADTEFYKRFLV